MPLMVFRSRTRRLAFASNATLAWSYVDTGQTDVDDITLDYPRAGASDLVTVTTVESGTAYLYTADEEGNLTLAITIGTATAAAHCHTKNGILYTFRLDSGTIYGRAYDLQGNAIESEWTTNLTGVDDDEIDARVSIGPGGEQRIGILHLVSGTAILKTSPDGKTFA